MTPTPRDLGFRMPAEWERHAATWMSWPHKEESWPEKFSSVPRIFIEIVRLLSSYETVHINVNDEAMEAQTRELLTLQGVSLKNVVFHIFPTNDAWCRDHGPTFLVREKGGAKELALVDWSYNAWGEKYLPYDLDDQIPSRVAEYLGIPRFVPGIVMEGGSLDVNGAGTMLTTESCLLNPNRNRHLSKKEIEGFLEDYLGVSRILWLGEGISGDDTDGHIDDLARFVDPSTVVTVVEDDPQDVNFKPLRENLRRLQLMTDQSGRRLNIVTLPMPRPAFFQGQRLPCSYANFYIANDILLVPTYDPDRDSTALETLQRLFPSRRVVGLDCMDLVWGLGAFHCVTQQQPAL